MSWDAVLLVSFGGPEGPADVAPFLANVTRGRGVPPERLAVVAGHYERFGGVSPLNAANRALLARIGERVSLPVYWGNRNWHPLLADTMRQMRADGVRRALAFLTSVAASYSSCRQYQEDLARAREEVGKGAPEVETLRLFYNHPLFLDIWVDRVAEVVGVGSEAPLVFTAHSIPLAMSERCSYVAELREAARLVAAGLAAREGRARPWALVWQSRSGPPTAPWLEPDVGDHLEALAGQGVRRAVLVPIGFVSDHMEVVWDLDEEAARRAAAAGLEVARAITVGSDPRFADLVAELVAERVSGVPRRWVGSREPSHDRCLPGCCPPG
ncbi:MAG: ferrochelatase [Mycobacteriales bacterium]